MKREILATCIGALVFAGGVGAEPDGSSVEVNVQIVSDYVFRGQDMLSNNDLQRQKADSSSPRAPAFQPSVTFNTPVQGLYANLWGSFAMVNRDDTDVDGRIQFTPGGAFIGPGSSIVDPLFQADPGAALASVLPAKNSPVMAYANVPNFYKEPVGLRRNDEVDLTIGYEKDSRAGVVGFGLTHYSYANPRGKNNPFQSCYGNVNGETSAVACGSGYLSNEIFITYAFPFLKDLKFGVHSDLLTGNLYLNGAYNKTVEMNRIWALEGGLNLGYYVLPGIQGMNDVTGKIGVKVSGFVFGVNAAYRPDRRLYDYNFGAGDPLTHLPIQINGLSTAYDGQKVDPSRAYGPVNEYVNGQISSEIQKGLGLPYVYIPRQAIRPVLYWVNFGYTTTI